MMPGFHPASAKSGSFTPNSMSASMTMSRAGSKTPKSTWEQPQKTTGDQKPLVAPVTCGTWRACTMTCLLRSGRNDRPCDGALRGLACDNGFLLDHFQADFNSTTCSDRIVAPWPVTSVLSE